jgi:transposase-like protein
VQELVGDPTLSLNPARTAELFAACKQASEEDNKSQAARAGDVSRSTLARWMRAQQANATPLRPGHPTWLDVKEEQRLVALALVRQSLNAPLTKPAFGRLAAAMMRSRNMRFLTPSGLPGADWWARFHKHWPVLSARTSSRLSSEALIRPTRENLAPWFALVDSIRAVVPPELWFNIDESQLRGDSPKVLVRRGTKHVHSAKPGYKGHVTLVPCVSATGVVKPPLFIFQGQRADISLVADGPKDSAVAVTGAMPLKVELELTAWCLQNQDG